MRTLVRKPCGSLCSSHLSGRNPPEAVRNFLAPVQRAISCVTPAVLTVSRGGYEPRAEPHGVVLNQNRPVALEMREYGVPRISLLVAMEYVIVEAAGDLGPWRVSIRQYSLELLRADKRLFAFHWHPQPPNVVKTPHLHLPKEPGTCAPALALLHIPTGRVSVEELIRLALEIGVQPRRDDFDAVLTATQRAHEERRSWGGSGSPT